jgi:hypothetical protein
MAAEFKQTRLGVATVAKSLSLLGAGETAAAIMARVQPTWPSETTPLDERLVEGCVSSKAPLAGNG